MTVTLYKIVHVYVIKNNMLCYAHSFMYHSLLERYVMVVVFIGVCVFSVEIKDVFRFSSGCKVECSDSFRCKS